MPIKIDWSQIDTVLLDMDGTLLDLHFDNYFWLEYLPAVYAQKNNITLEKTIAKFKPLFIKYTGTLKWYSVDFWSEELGLDVMRHKEDIANKINYRPQAQDFLALCREKVTDLRLVTNAHRKVLELKIAQTQLDQYFDVLVCSHELNAPKEEQAFWNSLQQQQEFDLQRTLFIDDSESVLDSARKYGIKRLLSIEEPDSVKARTSESKYQMIDSFF